VVLLGKMNYDVNLVYFFVEIICSIDPADAKDLDDALSVKEVREGVYEIGVHIADVSHFV